MYFPGLEDMTCVVVVNRLKDYRDGLDASSRHQKSIARSRVHAWTTEEEQILTTLTEEQKRKALVVKLGPTPFGVPGLENCTHQAVKMRLYHSENLSDIRLKWIDEQPSDSRTRFSIQVHCHDRKGNRHSPETLARRSR